MRTAWLLVAGMLAVPASADDAIPLPFEGEFESLGSAARERTVDGSWRNLAQDVRMGIARDGDIVELQLRIDVLAPPDGRPPYRIDNAMWLVRRSPQPATAGGGRVDFDVYKLDRATGRFEDRGDGYCSARECAYGYVTQRPGRMQRYQSRITWEDATAGRQFQQRGSLAARTRPDADWVTFKDWENVFRAAE